MPVDSDASQKSVAPEFFIRGLFGSLHAITFDNQGNMLVGSMGDKQSDIGQPGMRKIYRVSPEKKIGIIAEVSCTYLSALVQDSGGNLYAACRLPMKIIKISPEGLQTVLADDETYNLQIDPQGNLYYGSYGKTYRITPAGIKSIFSEADGFWDMKAGYIYSKKYGGTTIIKHSIERDGTLGVEEILIGDLINLREITKSVNGNLWILGHRYSDNCDYLARLDETGKVVEQINLTFTLDSRPGALNNLMFGQGAFGSDYIYTLTYTGDILRVKVE